MNLTYEQSRNVQHLAIDFYIEYDADAFNELRIDPTTKVPEFVAIDEADTGESRLYFTYSDPTTGDCEQFHLNNVSDAMGAVTTVANIYRTLNYNPSDLIRSFEKISSDDIKLLSLLANDFDMHIRGMHTSHLNINEQLGSAYPSTEKEAEWVDITLTYKKSPILDEIGSVIEIEEIYSNEIIEELLDVAKTYSEYIDNPSAFVDLY